MMEQPRSRAPDAVPARPAHCYAKNEKPPDNRPEQGQAVIQPTLWCTRWAGWASFGPLRCQLCGRPGGLDGRLSGPSGANFVVDPVGWMGVFRAPPVANFVVDPVGRMGVFRAPPVANFVVDPYVMWRLVGLQTSAQRKVRQRKALR